jgi:muramoyltetrapeptide carboxypeptidase LdcA involved in peptidoglycan recycling
MRYPKTFKDRNNHAAKGIIYFAAPSFGCAIEPYHSAFLHALERFENTGYKIILGENCFRSEGIGISSTPQSCGKELNAAFVSEADAVLSCGGGELMCEILEYVDFETIRTAEPKWFMGYSDNTNVTFLLNTLCDTAAIYGPCAPSFGMEPWHPALLDAWALLSGSKYDFSGYDGWEKDSKKDEEHPLAAYHITEACRYVIYDGIRSVSEAKVTGRLLGGCLDCLNNLVGTRFDRVADFNARYGKEGVLWFLESCDLNVFDIRRALWHMKQAGWFDCAKGFLIGRPGCFGQKLMGLDQYRAVVDVLGALGVPIIMDLDFGHLPPAVPLLSGSIAQVQVTENQWHIHYDLR